MNDFENSFPDSDITDKVNMIIKLKEFPSNTENIHQRFNELSLLNFQRLYFNFKFSHDIQF